MEDWLDLHPDPAHVRREREKARELRRTPWWRAQIAKGVCHYCGQHVGPENLTLDHVVPVARGGRSTRGNCVPCCRDCNAKKKAYTPAEQILAQLFPGAVRCSLNDALAFGLNLVSDGHHVVLPSAANAAVAAHARYAAGGAEVVRVAR